MTAALLDLVIPIPPSVNAVWRSNSTHYYRSPAYKIWANIAGDMVKHQIPEEMFGLFPLGGPLLLEVVIHPGPLDDPGWNWQRDCDNTLKAPQDLIAKKIKHAAEHLARRIHLIRNDSSKVIRKSSAEMGAACEVAHARIVISSWSPTQLRQPAALDRRLVSLLRQIPPTAKRPKRPDLMEKPAARTLGGRRR